MMNKKDEFGSYNPWVLVTFYTMVIIGTILISNPIAIAGSFLAGVSYVLYQKGQRAIKFIFFLLPMMLLGALLNPVFNHRGSTILTYFRDNPITLEAVVFGIASAFMIGSIIFWFSTFNYIITSDKLMYLGSKIVPSITLVFAMVLRFVPRFERQVEEIIKGQKALGRKSTEKKFLPKMRFATKIMSVMTTWSLENSVDLANSMKARGFGACNRTTYAIFKFCSRDFCLLSILILIIGIIIGTSINIFHVNVNMRIYPTLAIPEITLKSIAVNVAVISGYFVPLIINFYEDLKWKRLISKI